ncbi:hypothetical protein [Actinophytocola algeriensis]|uniref:Uncharacterized protein n=1 Tax=Actinophytocola algeriensis TaxID=1768010 RepID=A0A7W7QFX2_9PSEU|nr:hypothetical protein [Actinophytocola algeriensis]MBB4912890.1 hypothetical protein [Actinophytocola algeriensis]MBE1474087.1 hypothetical protein [Actinophytocola algeriensis]
MAKGLAAGTEATAAYSARSRSPDNADSNRRRQYLPDSEKVAGLCSSARSASASSCVASGRSSVSSAQNALARPWIRGVYGVTSPGQAPSSSMAAAMSSPRPR